MKYSEPPRELNGSGRIVSPAVSIVIDNYNYGHFLADAVDSALEQTYQDVEVIVVDDGSTDDSRQIISRYGDRIAAVFKDNGGQASALNAGFAASRGDVILFLDADDTLASTAVSRIATVFTDDSIAKVHWPLHVVDKCGKRTGKTAPPQIPPEGDFRDQVIERGPSNVASSPTSGNAWSRSFLDRVLPIPETVPYYRLCADEYLYTLAPVFGRVKTIADPLGSYRIHGDNVYSSRSFREKLEMEISGHGQQCCALSDTLARNGITVDVASWKQHSWFHHLQQATDEVLRTVAEGQDFVLIDGNTWGLGADLEGRTLRRFRDQQGLDWGPPANDDAALGQLEHLLEQEVSFLVIAWACFWWFKEYPEFFERLRGTTTSVVENDSVVIFRLQESPAKPHAAGAISSVKGGSNHA